ncbi:DNA polymerase III subunit alpha [Candidatus Hodgkinia cicadicola]|uniref:DNA polymerase III subunit alpha n=1 Tax=Candidatus Hodgkinia cicadicola TaxID=573658 RepID=A0ABX4MJQ4_9HYPH|nr:DNA polymerase III subunit alpha [Candidatus Hodgkinia cicadicola]
MQEFVNLKVHSIYSILESTLKIDRIAELASECQQKAVCLTDSNLHGSLEFCIKCIELGVKPIIGCKLAIDYKDILVPHNKNRKGNIIITVLVRSELGYKNLLKLINHSDWKNNYYVIGIKDLYKFSDGLICLIGGIGGLAWHIYNMIGPEKTNDKFNIIKDIFGNNLCIELERNMFTNPAYEEFLTKYAKKNKLIIVAINETYFESPEDINVIEILQSISKRKLTYISENNYFNDYKSMISRFSDIVEAVKNTVVISNMCNFYLKKKRIYLPTFFKNKRSEDKVLYLKSIETLEYMFYLVGKICKEIYYERILKELMIIIATNYSGYFLIVSDFTLWSKNNNVYVGPGRGSASGSLIAYCLGITNIDPMVHGLIFERFLNANRISLPDIDIDFCQNGRERVIRYIQLKYGIRNIGQIITFGSLQIRAAIKDVGRYLSIPYDTLNLLCKSIPMFDLEAASILDALDKTQLISRFLFEKIINIIIKLIGLYRHVSTHAAGLVICNVPLESNVPVVWEKENEIGIVQHSMNWVESAGLPKFDLLGLKTLTAVDEMLENIIINRIHIDLECYTDRKSFELICRGKVLGTFQFEGKGMTKHIKHIKPSSMVDLTALIALYRPGPIKHIKLYADAKWNRIKRTSLHQAVDYILDETYGIVIYQEQVMLIAQKLAGYSLSEADILRRAMAKKDKREMSVQSERFIKGAVMNGLNYDLANEIFVTLSRFADYGFNKSHAVAYSSLAYITSYLKSNFPLEFYVSNMNVEIIDPDRVSALYYDALSMGVSFVLPSIRLPTKSFIIGNNRIHFPLSVIKGLGDSIIDSIVKSMGNNKFKSLFDLCLRLDKEVITKKILESLILSGALDCFNIPRKQLVLLLKDIMICLKTKQDYNNHVKDCPMKDIEDLSLPLLYQEYLILNCYVSRCPISLIKQRNKLNTKNLCVVVNQKGSSLTIVTAKKKLDVIYKTSKRLKLGKIYEYSLEKTEGRIYCHNLVLLKENSDIS